MATMIFGGIYVLYVLSDCFDIDVTFCTDIKFYSNLFKIHFFVSCNYE